MHQLKCGRVNVSREVFLVLDLSSPPSAYLHGTSPHRASCFDTVEFGRSKLQISLVFLRWLRLSDLHGWTSFVSTNVNEARAEAHTGIRGFCIFFSIFPESKAHLLSSGLAAYMGCLAARLLCAWRTPGPPLTAGTVTEAGKTWWSSPASTLAQPWCFIPPEQLSMNGI